jgi:hypothetical protein
MSMKLIKRMGTVLLASAAFVAAGAAHADTTWNWSYSGDSVIASGTFTTAGNALTAEDILSFSGTRNGTAILGLVPLDSDENYVYDNQFTSVAPHLSEPGILFDIGGGTLGSHVNVYWDSNDGLIHELQIDPTESFIIDTVVNLSVTAAVPEPATYGMLALGLVAVGAVARRRRNA